ncbi:transglycosylase domain-containing protein [Flavobacterium sp.]|uniref:transglycosylase domain-containing protein n=1 Tax=Flavobacterium sp. TaxID=239 RepID=UPI00374D83C8
MRTKKQTFFLFLKILVAFLLSALTGAYVFRDDLLQKAVIRISSKFNTDYNCNFSVQKAHFDGISGIELDNIILVPKDADTLFVAEKIKTKISLFQLVTGDVQLQNLEIKNGFIQLVKNESGNNFDSFLNSNTKEDTNEKRNYAKSIDNIISKVSNLIPTQMSLQNISLRINDMGNKTTFQTNQLELKNDKLDTSINVKTSTFLQKWNIKGLANPRDKTTDLYITNSDPTQIRLPYIKEKFNIASSFDRLHFKIDEINMSFGELTINGFASVENLTVNHPKISKKNVVFDKSSFNFKFLIGSDFISVKDNSEIEINDIKVSPYFEYNTKEDKIYNLKAKVTKMKAQEFINSLPKGLFSHFEGMEAQGDFDYMLDFKYNIKKPWMLVFNSKFNKYNLKITKYGQANLEKLNSDFTYRAIENGKQQRPVLVGTENTFYTPLDQISPYLQKSVLTCEDPSFMTHRGFVTEAFKQSIIKNIRTKKFARGASTISMQLVKNVFLTREKTLSRKLEEILLVYLLENNRIASKERMLEVYFNIIEWGPNVYGIGEAAPFYFQKKPIDLTLKECLFLASIVPKPKKFMYLFDEEGKLKSFATKHEEFISKLMLRRGLLMSEDTIGQKNPITISGRARTHMKLKVQDSIPVDSLFVNELEPFN